MPRPNYARFAVLLVFLIVLYYVYRVLEPFLPALVWAAILATVFHPLYASLARRLRHPRGASALTCVFVTVVIVLPALFIILMLAKESVAAYKALEEHMAGGAPPSVSALQKTSAYQWFLAKLSSLGMPEPDLGAVATKGIGLVSGFLVGRSARIFSGITHSVINFFVMLFGLYYLLLRGPHIIRELRELSFLRPEYEDRIIEEFRTIAVATFGGSLAAATIHGAVDGLIFLIFGLPSPLLWGAVMAVLSLVPVIGTALVWAPLVIYYILKGEVVRGILMLVISSGAVAIIDNVIKPVLIRRGTELDSIWVLLSVLGGIWFFGFMGLFLGPFLVAILLVMVEIFKGEFRQELGGDITAAKP